MHIFDSTRLLTLMPPMVDIPVKDLIPFMRSLPDQTPLLMEYQSIDATPINQTCVIGLFNKPKNRYKNILPFDHNVLPVSNIPDLDYINASMVKGYDGEEQFIATQGPIDESKLHIISKCFKQEALNFKNLSLC